jgi:hypothetical protein
MPKVTSWLIASILGACTAQAGIQPILAAKDVDVAKKSALITAFIIAPFGILTALLGMFAKAKHPDLLNAKTGASHTYDGLGSCSRRYSAGGNTCGNTFHSITHNPGVRHYVHKGLVPRVS